MTLKLISVENAGSIENERVVLRAMANVNIGKYVLLRTRMAPKSSVFSGPISAAYWFETIQINSSDFVVLYSKAGSRSQKVGDDQVTSHFFYWGLNEPVWQEGFKPSLIQALSWEW